MLLWDRFIWVSQQLYGLNDFICTLFTLLYCTERVAKLGKYEVLNTNYLIELQSRFKLAIVWVSTCSK